MISEELFDTVGMIDPMLFMGIIFERCCCKSNYRMKLAQAWEQRKRKMFHDQVLMNDIVEMKRLAMPVMKNRARTGAFLRLGMKVGTQRPVEERLR